VPRLAAGRYAGSHPRPAVPASRSIQSLDASDDPLLRLISTAFLALCTAIVWLIAAFFSGPGSRAAELAFGPGNYLRDQVLPYEAAAWLYGRDSQGAHHGLLAWLSIGVWTIAFLPLAWLALKRLRRRSANAARDLSSNNSLERPR
jgi:hypothetical protein